MSSEIILIIHVIIAVALVGLILIQHGKGADAGAAFGSGASSTVFGSQGSASFLTRITAGLATAFFITSLTLAYMTRSTTTTSSDDVPAVIEEVVEEKAPVGDKPEMPAIDSADKPSIPAADTPDKPSIPAADTSDKPATPATTEIPE